MEGLLIVTSVLSFTVYLVIFIFSSTALTYLIFLKYTFSIALLSLSLHLFRIRNCLAQLYAKDITPDDKQELDEALQREVCVVPRM